MKGNDVPPKMCSYTLALNCACAGHVGATHGEEKTGRSQLNAGQDLQSHCPHKLMTTLFYTLISLCSLLTKQGSHLRRFVAQVGWGIDCLPSFACLACRIARTLFFAQIVPGSFWKQLKQLVVTADQRDFGWKSKLCLRTRTWIAKSIAPPNGI